MRTTAVDVMNFQSDRAVLTVDRLDKKSEDSAIRAVQRFLLRQGYKQGSRKGSNSIHLSKAHAMTRDAYVHFMYPRLSSTDPPFVVYTYESYIHHHYKRHHDSLY
ncbi:hypothetical protein AC1031_017084 [Aphanomyces cochlioides]|nr:hypothetical protein AC1031_017084 [Aphanomyces cochlioides]